MDYSTAQLCRLCLTPSPKHCTSIGDSVWRTKLDVVFKFELPLEDTLPNLICAECSIKIDEFYHFHESVLTNQIKLKANSITDHTMVVLVEVKGEPMNEEEAQEANLEELNTVAAAVEQSESFDDYESKPQIDTNLEGLMLYNDMQSSRNKIPDDNWKIEEFFNGITCSFCSEKFKTFGKLRTHCRRTHGQKASITCCDRKYFKKCYLIDHINSHQGSKSFYCELCNKNYTTKHYLKIHNSQLHANSEELPYPCSTCGKKFSRESLLNAHLKHHVQVKCSLCDRTMASIHSLKIHMLKMHSKQPLKPITPHVCDFCGRTYNHKHSLEKHINLLHLGAKDTDRIQCPVCDKWVNSKQYLKVHMLNAHSGENLQVTCDICRHVCANKRALSTHKNKVHAKRQLACEVCGKMFKLQRHLKEHRAAHMGQQLYTCSVCGYGSNYNGNIYTHIKNKHPVECAEAKAKGENLMITESDPSEVV